MTERIRPNASLPRFGANGSVVPTFHLIRSPFGRIAS
jgi:hypothetical protein